MVKNAYITIVALAELSELRLYELIGRHGLIVEDLSEGRRKTEADCSCWKRTIWMNSFGLSPKMPCAMNKLFTKCLLLAVVLLGGAVYLQHRQSARLKAERDRYRFNNTALLSVVKRMQLDSATMTLDTNTLWLTLDEYKQYRAKDAATIKRLGVKIKDLEAAARHELEVSGPIDATIRDTVIIRDTMLILL